MLDEAAHALASGLLSSASVGIRVFLAVFVAHTVVTVIQSVLKERVKALAESCLARCGVRPQGADVAVDHDYVVTEVARAGVLGLGDTYVAGLWSPAAGGDAAAVGGGRSSSSSPSSPPPPPSMSLDDILVRLTSAEGDEARRIFYSSWEVG